MDGALRNGIVETPSGRQYYWPSVVRVKKDRVSNATQILNYPVQGFAADIVQLACIRARRKFIELNLKSKLILTVHDSICVDTHPNELDIVKEALTWAMTGVNKEAQRRWNYNMVVPLEIEISGGNNWLDQEEYT
jgi:DNA polymerase-1